MANGNASGYHEQMWFALTFALSCAPDDGAMRRGAADSRTGDDTGWQLDTGGVDTGLGPCPSDMVAVGETWCVDRCEAALEELGSDGAWTTASPYDTVEGRTVRAVVACGEVPQGYISGEEAAAACEASGKVLCSTDAWLAACEGPDETTWPYGDTYVEGACNDTYEGSHPVIDYFGNSEDVWNMDHMNDPGINQQPDTVDLGGANLACVSWWGAYDLHGNLHEWVDDPEGTFRGGFYADAEINGPGCTYTTTFHPMSYHDYSTGFRCCSMQ